jgi:crotonobetainyl-CoA:carnitine CoA-transferase CaiB-like acyl-CoA transferase
VPRALAADTADHWETRLRALGVPARSVRTLPEALSDASPLIAAADGYRLVGSPIRIEGHERPRLVALDRIGSPAARSADASAPAGIQPTAALPQIIANLG